MVFEKFDARDGTSILNFELFAAYQDFITMRTQHNVYFESKWTLALHSIVHLLFIQSEHEREKYTANE